MLKQWAIVGLIGAMFACPVRAAEENPTETLKAKGLTRQGLYFVLAGEAELATKMRDVRMAKKKMEDDARLREGIEGNIRRATAIMANLQHDRQLAATAAANAKTERENNRAVAAIEQIEMQLKQGVAFKADQEAKLKALGDNARTAYIQLVSQLGENVKQVQDEYATLGEDSAVKTALEEINKKGTAKVKLGPGMEFQANAKEIQKLLGDVMSESIKLKPEGNIFFVDVVLNGKLTRQFVLDSGASLTCIPAGLAEELDMMPTDKDETIRFQQADGKVIEAKRKTIKNVRVGAFAVEDVECAVYPRDLPNTPLLLGGSFLSNFVYKIDSEKGELHLASLANKKVSTGIEKPQPKTPTPPKNGDEPVKAPEEK